jgi:hypothetical protein
MAAIRSMSPRRIAGGLVAAIAYGLVFHAVTRLCVAAFGAVPPESDTAFPTLDVTYLAFSSLASAAAIAFVWIWKADAFTLRDGLVVGAWAVLLIAVNVTFGERSGGFGQFVAARPIHAAASFGFAFLAPIFWAAVLSRRRSGLDGDVR